MATAAPNETYRERLANIRILEESRHNLIEELLIKVEKAEAQLQQVQLDLNSEQNVRRRFQEEAREIRDKMITMEKETIEAKGKALAAEEELAKLKEGKDTMEKELATTKDESTKLKEEFQGAIELHKSLEERSARRPIAVVLIDANPEGLLFQDKYITKGFKGGEKAAEDLLAQVNELLLEANPNLVNMEVIIKVYANLEGLADLLMDDGKVRNLGQLRSFTTAFSYRSSFCDFIDVGKWEDGSAIKVKELARLYASSYNCKHVFVGAACTGMMTSFLDQLANETPNASTAITLLENSSVPMETLKVPFNILALASIFKLPLKRSRAHQITSGRGEDTLLVTRPENSPSRRNNKNSDNQSVVISFGPDSGVTTNSREHSRSDRRRIMA